MSREYKLERALMVISTLNERVVSLQAAIDIATKAIEQNRLDEISLWYKVGCFVKEVNGTTLYSITGPNEKTVAIFDNQDAAEIECRRLNQAFSYGWQAAHQENQLIAERIL